MPALLKQEEQKKIREGESLTARPLYLQAWPTTRRARASSSTRTPTCRCASPSATSWAMAQGRRGTPRSPPGRRRRQGNRRRSVRSPKALLDAVKAKRYGGLEDKRLGSVPVNFLSNLDITGGNSGSPVLDANGKLVGLAFDGNWESVSSNWVFDPVMTRMIAVDSRYMQWIMQEVAPAPQLLKELNLPKQRCVSPGSSGEPTGAGFIRPPSPHPAPACAAQGGHEPPQDPLHMRILLARHGETPWNAEGRYQGQIDIPLSPIGEAQAQAWAPAWPRWTSPVPSPRRCRARSAPPSWRWARPRRHAADRAGAAGNRPRRVGGLLASEIHEKDPSRLQAWREEPDTVLMPGGESLRLVLERSWRGLARPPKASASTTPCWWSPTTRSTA
jgi:hypothetical protein